jgi:hypothetical protein
VGHPLWREDGSFVCAAGPCQRSLSRVLVPWDLWPYFTVSDLRLPFLSPPTTRRVTVEVFDPASISESESYVTTDSQLASLSWYKAPIRGLRPDFFSVPNTEYVWQLCSSFRGTPSLTRGRVCLLYVPLTLASTVFLGRSPLGLATVFYCLRFETSIFVASYDSQGHGGGIRPRLHTGSPPYHLSSAHITLSRTAEKTRRCPYCCRLCIATAVYQPLLSSGWFVACDCLALDSLQLSFYLATAVYPAVA